MRVRKGELTRRDFLKVTSIITGSALLSACSGILEIAPTLTPSPTLTGTPSSTPTQTPAPTQPKATNTPEKKFVLPKKPDGTFDFADVEHYPVLETVDPDDPTSDLSLFIKQVRSEGLMRDFSNIPVPDVSMISIDHRDTMNDSWPRGINIKYNHFILYTSQTVPAFVPAMAKFSIPMNGFDEPLYFAVEQLYCDESPQKSVTVIPVIPGRHRSKEIIQQLGDQGVYLDLAAAYNQSVMSGPLENVRTQQEYDAWLLQQYMGRGNLAIVEMHERKKITPSADNALFIGDISRLKVADSTSSVFPVFSALASVLTKIDKI